MVLARRVRRYDGYRGFKDRLTFFRVAYGPGEPSRSELEKGDIPLYRLLLKNREIEVAIPTVLQGGRPVLSLDAICNVIGSYYVFDARASVAAEELGVNRTTILDYWKMAKFPIIRGRPGVSEDEKNVL